MDFSFSNLLRDIFTLLYENYILKGVIKMSNEMKTVWAFLQGIGFAFCTIMYMLLALPLLVLSKIESVLKRVIDDLGRKIESNEKESY